MQARPGKQNLLGCSKTELETFFAGLGEKPFRARQLLQWIYQRQVIEFEAMTDLSKRLRQALTEAAEIVLPEPVSRQESADGTVKWLFASGSGQAV